VLAWLAAGLLFAASPQGPALAPRGGPRASAATRAFVSAPYLASPLGEGEGPDPDPRFRLDAFDCMTLVETAVALGSAASPEEAAVALDDIRYSGPPALARRNHEVLSQWIPANVAKGWVAPLTRALAGDATFVAEKTYTPESWETVRRAGRAIRGLPRARLPLGRFAIDAVPLADVPALARRIPDGTIVLAVRADAPDRATRVTHAALAVRGPRGEVLVRHATSSKGVGRVIEEPLERFVRREERAHPRWPLEGLSFFEIRDNAARLRALLSPSVHGARGGASGRPPPPPPPPL
jgi:N-acetylmuramoyl-L-alanine amidase-like protein